MPNVLGLFTKQEAKEIRDINVLPDSNKLKLIAEVIKEAQQIGTGQTQVTLNMVVHTDVEKYFKNTVGYTTVQNTAGQAPNHTLLISISWA